MLRHRSNNCLPTGLSKALSRALSIAFLSLVISSCSSRDIPLPECWHYGIFEPGMKFSGYVIVEVNSESLSIIFPAKCSDVGVVANFIPTVDFSKESKNGRSVDVEGAYF